MARGWRRASPHAAMDVVVNRTIARFIGYNDPCSVYPARYYDRRLLREINSHLVTARETLWES